MYQYDDPTVLPTLPTPAAPGTAGFFTDGNPGAALPATILRSDFMNMLMMELLNVVEASGQVPSKTTYNQVLTALTKMCGPVVGSVRNARMLVATAASTATFTADEIIVETILGGAPFKLSFFNQSVNLAVSGIGGVVGTGPVANGYAAIYAAWGSGVGSGIFATSGALLMPQVYAGSLPAGYTASALISVWQLNGAGQFTVGFQRDRKISVPLAMMLTTATPQSTFTPLSVASIIPPNAVSILGSGNPLSTTSSSLHMRIASDINGAGSQFISGGGNGLSAPFEIDVETQQTLFYTCDNNGASGPTFQIFVCGYRI